MHRDWARTGDEGADLGALARHPVVTVCAGVKSFLDLAQTLERLETLGVPVRWGRHPLRPGAGGRGTGGRSVRANVALVEDNARWAAALAAALEGWGTLPGGDR